MRRLLRLEVLFFLLPICIACVQTYLTSTTDLTRWRGGGFGMYSDPHPNQGRNVWLMGTRDGGPAAVRLFPADGRWDVAAGHPLQDVVANLEREAMEYRDFPSLPNVNPIRTRVEELLDEYGAEPAVVDVTPNRNLSIEVIEIAISADWDSLVATRIAVRTW